MPPSPLDLSDPIAAWLLSPEALRLPLDELVFELMRLVETDGIALARFSTSLPSRNPQIPVRSVVWIPDEGMMLQHRPPGGEPPAADSPLSALHEGADELRLRLTGPGADLRYPVCHELAARGATDYLLRSLPFSDGQRGYLAWASALEGGFSDEHLRRLRSLTAAVALRFELETARFAAESLLVTYLGQGPAQQALAGVPRSGPGEPERAVVVALALRGFSGLVARSAPEALSAFHRFVTALTNPILSRSGEIHTLHEGLVLVTFPLAENPFFSCQRALMACRHAEAEVAALGDPALAFGAALHAGEVVRAVLGTLPRLGFAIAGAAIDEARTLESLGASRGEPLVASALFAKLANGGLESIGAASPPGSDAPRELFRPRS